MLGVNGLWRFGPEQERLGNLAQPEHGFGSRGRAEDSAICFPALTAGILAILSLVNLVWGIDLFGGSAEEWVAALIAVLTPLFVWLIPNRR